VLLHMPVVLHLDMISSLFSTPMVTLKKEERRRRTGRKKKVSKTFAPTTIRTGAPSQYPPNVQFSSIQSIPTQRPWHLL